MLESRLDMNTPTVVTVKAIHLYSMKNHASAVLSVLTPYLLLNPLLTSFLALIELVFALAPLIASIYLLLTEFSRNIVIARALYIAIAVKMEDALKK